MIPFFPPQRSKAARNLGDSISPLLLEGGRGVFCSLREDGKRVRGLLQKRCSHFTALHRRVGAQQEACPSAQTE